MIPIEIRAKRIYYLIPIPFILLLIWLFWIYFSENHIISGELSNLTVFFFVSLFVFLVGGFLLFFFISQYIKNPVIFRMDDGGFEYNAAGVTTGWVIWKEVKEVKEVSVKSDRETTGGYETALGVVLNNPEEYKSKYNFLLGKAISLSEQLNGASILIEPASLQGQYDLVKKEMEAKIRRLQMAG